MPIAFVIGRVVFVVYFVFAGLQRLMNIAASADFISHRFAIPAGIAGVAGQIESIVGLSTPQIIAVFAGAIELAAGVLIAFNVGTRAMSVILVVMTALAIYYSNDFWHMSGDQRDENLIRALLQISLIGALIVFVSLGSARPIELDRPTDV